MLLRRFGTDVKFIEKEPDKTINNSSKLVEVMKSKISAKDHRKLREMYALDYTLFGYN